MSERRDGTFARAGEQRTNGRRLASSARGEHFYSDTESDPSLQSLRVATNESDTALSTFVVADLAGYSALTEAHGDHAAADAATAFCERVRTLAEAQGGEHVKTMGDGILLRFADAATAAEAAIEIITAFGARHEALNVRIGVNTGTAIYREGDWFGAAVNVASRVADIADAGQIIVTPRTRTAAVRTIPLDRFRSVGTHKLKNMADGIELFELVASAEAAAVRLEVDPVCRMVVDPAHAHSRVTTDGLEYTFCSEDCRRAFEESPERFAGSVDPAPQLGSLLQRVVRRFSRAR